MVSTAGAALLRRRTALCMLSCRSLKTACCEGLSSLAGCFYTPLCICQAQQAPVGQGQKKNFAASTTGAPVCAGRPVTLWLHPQDIPFFDT